VGLLLLVTSLAALFRDPSSDESGDANGKILLVLLDGANERVFRRLLVEGKLRFLAQLHHPVERGRRRAIYTAATSIWPSTTGPAYAPFVSGLYPGKSDLAGIRQFVRNDNELRVYQLQNLRDLGQDLSRNYPTIYEVLGREETFNQQGWVTRRGWNKESGEAHRPLHENFSSALGLYQGGVRHLPLADHFALAQEVDRSNAISFLNYVMPFLDAKKRDVFRNFPGRELQWGARGASQILKEGAFSLLGLERVVREKSFRSFRLGRLPSFSFISLHLPDDISHSIGPGTEEDPSEHYRRAFRSVDEIIGAMVEVFKAYGEFEKLTLIVSSDHGVSRVGPTSEFHVNITEKLSQETGIPIRQASKRSADRFNEAWKERGEHRAYAGVATVSGNANVQFHLRKPGSESWRARPSYDELRAYRFRGRGPVDLVAWLSAEAAVSHVFLKNREQGTYHVLTGTGEAIIATREADGGGVLYSYRTISGTDPFGYAESSTLLTALQRGAFHDGDTWAAATRDTGYPDAVVQVVQLLDARTSGDLLVDAADGYEPWDEMQRGLHGSLKREHIVVPLFIYSPRLDYERALDLFTGKRLPRTVDVYPTMLRFFGAGPPNSITWERRRCLIGPLQTDSARVDSDIDGEPLEIWLPRGSATDAESG
jgi:hypothetical protein